MPDKSELHRFSSLGFFLVIFALAGLSACAGPTANSVLDDHARLSDSVYDAKVDFRAIDYDRLGAACLLASNEARVANGAKLVTHHARLEFTGRQYARTMSRDQFVAHEHPTDTSQKTPEIRARNSGISNPFIAENIALIQGYPVPNGTPVYVRQGGFSVTPEGPVIGPHTYRSVAKYVVQGWLDSPGHRRNLLSGDALQLGCGAALTSQGEMPMFLFVQNFQFYEYISD
jgi:uncharacterized protein YkwD